MLPRFPRRAQVEKSHGPYHSCSCKSTPGMITCAPSGQTDAARKTTLLERIPNDWPRSRSSSPRLYHNPVTRLAGGFCGKRGHRTHNLVQTLLQGRLPLGSRPAHPRADCKYSCAFLSCLRRLACPQRTPQTAPAAIPQQSPCKLTSQTCTRPHGPVQADKDDFAGGKP